VVALAALREEHGLTRPAAAKILDVNVETLDRLEARIGLGWLNVAADKVRVYLQRLDLSPALLVRSIANQMPHGPSQVYAYRPRVIAEEPVTVEGSEDDLPRLIAWGHELYQ
jgi:transcriptional regulator with XRE-family HTH domain